METSKNPEGHSPRYWRKHPHKVPAISSTPIEEACSVAEKWSKSDRLAIALFLLSVAVAIILFLVEKTPAMVAVLISFLVASLIYPVLHFCSSRRSRTVAFAGIAILVAILAFFNLHPAKSPVSVVTGDAPKPSPEAWQPHVSVADHVVIDHVGSTEMVTHGRAVVNNSQISGGKVGIKNDGDLTINGSQIIDNDTNIVNTTDPATGRRKKTKPPQR
jgi:hypothetical protein